MLVQKYVREPMFDLDLLRVPTFLGVSIAALTMNGSLFAMFVYIVLYLQNTLGYSALQAGTLLLVVSAGTVVAAMTTARVSSDISARWLIGSGLALVGVGLLLIHGLEPGSTWTDLLAGLFIAGIGAGIVNPPLASTAVGVVPPPPRNAHSRSAYASEQARTVRPSANTTSAARSPHRGIHALLLALEAHREAETLWAELAAIPMLDLVASRTDHPT